ncbi:SpvB/TcaC N-terminal domain-containing protein [Streptomyces sp. H39-S7]|uniref:SpvB/TcaC N-terminal domain-containing protein n=1 Tax=Streptomyces sp. H39-S7 TaxID=3004357 RepID=UPI0022AFF470|nr:SpvB/TcaC N-terminal domain-containing protein [Streptomyces sp. H39-S7]MCZ4123095.1 SpvB/TcaC N-terminal domain-containing protein [Streptomyces sp. H39-S7]
MGDGADSTAEGAVLSLPKGGGAVGGIGETFAPDLFTGTGNFTVPIAVPAGRAGLEPHVSLAYSTGGGNGPFGLGWQLSLPGVSRKTSRGIPRYADAAGPGAEKADVFVLSGAEDLVPVDGGRPGRVRYRPRTEGLFARIEHVLDDSGNYWEVRGKDGLLTRYGTPRPAGADAAWRDPAVVADPADANRVFGWRITRTEDALGNLIRYDYLRDRGQEPGHTWDQPLLARISYADYGNRAEPSFLVAVDFAYEARPDAFSEHRAGFEVRTALRCRTVRVTTHAADGIARVARECRFTYQQAPFNGVSLLTRLDVVGIDDQGVPPGQEPATESLPPLTFGYSGFGPAGRRFEAVDGPGLPAVSLSDPALALVDLRGTGLPDLVELGAAARFWRNAGGGRFELPRQLAEAPPASLADPGVRFLDADGDGRADLVVPATATGAHTGGAVAGYYPMSFAGGWSRRSFRPYRQSPSVGFADPQVRLVDLDGDGLTDVLHSGTRLECWFNDPDPRKAWQRTAQSADGPPVDLADPLVRLADMTGDGLQDLVRLRNGNVTYWPNQGHGRWGARVVMRRSPRLPDRFDPRRLLLGDVDGDGAADLVYVDHGRVLLWGNRSGGAWTEQPVTITGTPGATSGDSLQLADLHGTGMAGLLFSRAADGSGRAHLRFLDFAGGVKPHLLTSMDNHLGATTRVTYTPSTQEYLRDQGSPATRWRTPLPFPVHVVSHVEVADALSGGRLTTQYRYHHGYWDGVEREFRGFAMVEHRDSEAFGPQPRTGPGAVPDGHFSPPTLTKSWFHPGPVAAAEAGEWAEPDLRHEYSGLDTPILSRPPEQIAFLAGLPRSARRSALRTLRGQLLRTELYALDGTDREHRPYTVTETLSGVREESPGPPGDPSPDARERIFFPFVLGSRTTQYERGDDPLTRFAFPTDHDGYGFPAGQIAVAVPRGRDPMTSVAAAPQPYLATYTTTEYARRDDTGHYLVDRVARTTGYEVVNDGRLSVDRLRDAILAGPAPAGPALRVIAHARTYYDGDAFTGLPLGTLGEHGLAVRAESLAFTDAFLDALHPAGDPLAVGPRPVYLAPGGVTTWPAQYPPEFRAALPGLAGYTHYTDSAVPGSPGGYYVTGARHRYDVHVAGRVPRGLPVASLDPLGALSQIVHDEHDLLPVRSVDPAGMASEAATDYRLLRPHTVTDANGNTVSVAFSPTGLVTAQYVRGKNGEGDRAAPGARMTYDLLAFSERGEPASVRTVRRVHHDLDTDVPAAERDETIVSVTYSDGFGRLLQTRSQAEDTLFGDPVHGGGVLPAEDLAPGGDTTGRTRRPSDPDNVIVSGWQVYDNKSRVVMKYEPFLSTGFGYGQPLDAQLGQKATMFHDPRGQVVRTLNPDGSEQRVLFGVPADPAVPEVFAPTPWESHTYDANDNAGRTHSESAAPYRGHWNTPAGMEIDALGRTVRAVARNGVADADRFTTRSAYDILGNLVSITDALGRPAVTCVFDVAGRRWRMDGVDTGRHDAVPDVLGRPVETRDSKGAMTLCTFDVLHRPSRVWAARDGLAGTVTLRQFVEYGDGGTAAQPPAARSAARALNLLGRPVRQHDEAGLVSVAAADFKGNVLESTRRVVADAPVLETYRTARSKEWKVVPFQIEWTPAAGQTQVDRDAQLLEPGGYTTTTRRDALNRIVRHVLPTDVEGHRRELRPTYNRAGALEQVRLDDVVYVRRITYDATGRRTLIAHGNGVITRYAYDPRTFRLLRLRSERYTLVDDVTYRPSGEPLQDSHYDYDLVGNLLTLRDRAPGSGIPDNPDALAATDPVLRKLLGSGDALDRRFTYDPVYRLLTATGREHQAPPPGDPWPGLPRGTDVTKAQPYTEAYQYDAADNLLSLGHSGTGGFRRDFTLVAGGNRLRRMSVGATPYDYTYDGSGNLVAETTSRHFEWNHADRMTAFATQTAGAEPSVHAQYLYDATGQRVKKLVRRQGGAVDVTHYLDGVFEHHRWAPAATSSTAAPAAAPAARENNHVHVMDDHRRVALVRVGAAHPDDRGPAIAFHLGDHLGSSTAVLDEAGTLTNREEYSPYGETSFGSHARKRYRFTGCERDEESGLSYHQARYFAPWNGRWCSSDPLGIVDGLNLYLYVRANPLRTVDPRGTNGDGVNDALDGALSRIDAVENPFTADGKAGSRPISMDIDEPLPVGESGISAADARARALDGSNRQLLDQATNRRTKYLGTDARATNLSRAAVSVTEDANILMTRNFNEITEMRTIFAQAAARIRDPAGMRPTALKDAINRNVWDIIKTDTGSAATRVRNALGELGFENVPGKGFRMRAPAGSSGGSPALAAEESMAVEAAEVGSGLSRAGRVLGFVGKAAIAIPVAYRSFMVGAYLREGHGWAALRQVGLLAWDLSPGPLMLASANARQELTNQVRATIHDPKQAEQALRMSCLSWSPSCHQ